MTDTHDEALACAQAVQRFLVAKDAAGNPADILGIVAGQALRCTQLRELLRLVYEQRDRILELAPEYGVRLQILEDEGSAHQVTYSCDTLADAQAKAEQSRERLPDALGSPQVVRRMAGRWQPVAAGA